MTTPAGTPATEGKRWYLWLRVSDKDQHPENQEPALRQMVERDGGTVVRVFLTKDSASEAGRDRGKGREFEENRAEVYNGLRRGDADGVAIWALDRITRLGAEDLLRYLRMLAEDAHADVRSHQEPWLNTVDPFARAVLIPLMATIAQFESKRKSERITAAMGRPDVVEKIRNRPPRGPDKKPRRRRGSPQQAPPPWVGKAQSLYDELDEDGKPAHTAHDIAEQCGTNVKVMYRRLNRNGPGGKARAAARKLTPDERAQAQAMWDETSADGAPAYKRADVAARFGLTENQLRRQITTHRGTLDGRGGTLPPLTDAQVAVLAALEARSPQATLQLGVRPEMTERLEERGLITRASRDGGPVWRINDAGLSELARRQAQEGTAEDG